MPATEGSVEFPYFLWSNTRLFLLAKKKKKIIPGGQTDKQYNIESFSTFSFMGTGETRDIENCLGKIILYEKLLKGNKDN